MKKRAPTRGVETHLVNSTGGQHEIMKSVLEVRRFPRSTAPEENQGMVPACCQHSSVSRLRDGVNVRRHVLALAAAEHVRDLRVEAKWSQSRRSRHRYRTTAMNIAHDNQTRGGKRFRRRNQMFCCLGGNSTRSDISTATANEGIRPNR